MKIRTSMYDISRSMSNISGAVDEVASQIDSNNKNSYAATAQKNLETFFKSIFSNIDQTLSIKPKVPIVTVYEVINQSKMLSNIQSPLKAVEEQLIFLLKDVFSTGFTGIVPVSISSLGNGVLGSFDNLSLASYFGFLFYFVGC